jgi:UDP-N-acetylglucosamine 4-epimerase
MRAGQPCTVYGDGTTSRDFCYVANVVQANVLAALTDVADCNHLVCNVAVGERTSLNELHRMIREGLAALAPAEGSAGIEPLYDSFRPGDVKHSLADIGLTRAVLGYEPTHTVSSGLAETLAWAITDLQQ